MSGIQLTPEQRAAVEDRGGNLLVSAAAGAGKTRVLVERLFRYVIEERCHLDDFLIITYTRAAAAELRGRIAQELTQRLAGETEDYHLRQQLYRVYRADIKTVDAFCTGLLRENVHLLEGEGANALTADFRVLDENEAELLRRRALRTAMEDFYARMQPEDGRSQLADTFGFGRDDRNLEELVLTLHAKVQSHAYPRRWLEEAAAFWRALPPGIDATPYAGILLEAAVRKLRHWGEALDRAAWQMARNAALAKGYQPGFSHAAGELKALAGHAATWEDLRGAEIHFPRLGAVKDIDGGELKVRMKALWEQCKKEVKAALAVFGVAGGEAMEDLRATAPAMTALLELTGAFDRAYRLEKLRRNVADFSDQEHLAIALLLGKDGEPTELCSRTAARYREIMVDEYQDTNEVQNTIFEALSRERHNLFAVGDVKQSIYRFRLADPTIFLRKYHTFLPREAAESGEDRKILLSRNFRSRTEVLDAANFIFSNILSQEMGEMDYGDDERLICGADYYLPRRDCGTEFHLLDAAAGRGEDFTASRPLAEARFVAEKVATMLREGFPVQDGEDLRPCQPQDFAILMRSPGPRLRHYVRSFRELGIPCVTQEREDFFSTMEIAVIYSLLQIVDNPRQDVPLISVLRSPIFGFSPDRLALIRGGHPAGDFYEALCADSGEDSRAFLDTVDALRRRAEDMEVHRLLWHIYNTFNVLGVFGAMAGGEGRRENLIALYEHACAFEAAGYKGLFAFVSHLRELLERGEQPDTAGGAGSGGVQIMSIHKSKGLEFPIVVLADLSKEFNRQDYQTPVLVHPDYGLGPVCYDLKRRIQYPTVARTALQTALEREGKAEEMRVLYVAMTRAKEKLILVASMNNAARRLGKLAALADCPVSPNAVGEASSMAEWVLLPLLCREEAGALRAYGQAGTGHIAAAGDSLWTVTVHEAAPYFRRREERAQEAAGPAEEVPFDPEILDFRYPHAAAGQLQTKITATQLKGRPKDQEIAEGVWPGLLPVKFEKPRFLSGERPLSAAERGTATHALMQYIPLDCPDVGAEVERLVAQRRLTAEQAAAVDTAAVERFLRSPLAREMRSAQKLWREYRFSLLTDGADYLGEEAAGEELLLQGVVDCFFETEDGLTVVDFKTDRVNDQEAQARRTEEYRAQVQAYSDALEKIFQKKVCRRVLYYFHTGTAVEV